MKWIVTEIQTYTDGTTGILTDSFTELNAAWQKYYAVLSAAAVSTVSLHTAIISTHEGLQNESKCFKHDTEV